MAIQRFLGENYGSLVKIEYVPARQISKFQPNSDGTIAAGNIQLKTGVGWEYIYCTQDTMGHRELQQVDDNGEPWDQTVVGFVPSDEPGVVTGLRLIRAGQRYVLRVTRPTGVVKIVGTPAMPLTIEVDSNSQISVPGRAGTALTFSGKTYDSSLIVS